MSERLLTRGVPSIYGTATCVPNDTSFIGDGKGRVVKTKPITITTETFVINKPVQPGCLTSVHNRRLQFQF
jgi:hypothetical protein